MFVRTITRLIWVGLPIVSLLSVITAFAATNQVSSSRLAVITRPITANDLKPPECAALNLTNIVVGSGRIDGTGSNDLILGSAGNDDIRGIGGSDCILGGAGDDKLTGGGGTDVCIGGPGNDQFVRCETRIQ